MSLGMRICSSSLIFSLLQLIKILLLMFNHSVVSNSLWPHGLQHARLPCPSSTPDLAQTHVHGVSDAIQPSHPLLPLLLLSSFFPRIRVLSNTSGLHIRWPKYWSFNFSINFLVLCLHYGPFFLVVMYRCESWTIDKADGWSIDAFKLWCWRRRLRVLGLQGDQTSQS